MPKIPKKIYESWAVIGYLQKRWLIGQYLKSCKKILQGEFGGSDLKKRKPTGSGIRSFRINRQFRAIGYWRDEEFFVVEIDNHQ